MDFDGADITGSSSFTAFEGRVPFSHDAKVDELGSVRGRLGWAIWPDLLAYGTAGLGYGHMHLNVTSFPDEVTSAANQFGWVAGGGLEYKIWEHVLLRAEYLHYDFAAVENGKLVNLSSSLIQDANNKTNVDVVRGGLTYKF